ncbi:hypothetical protein [Mycolicibacterium peregrinum]|uniref:DUF2516 family protein n=1 Tax=Mycolicibacterium peregrinum TaxID=43304 RepID=A0A1A0VAB5_MYCPR|nr:hypothetical protein [Mycolicibacterium peregrinum]OBB80178.1 hypothetical protein A5779_11725 [Mycolicibacterium peregrinum]
MSNAADTIITAILFVALLPAVVVAFVVGLHLIMLGDGVSPDRPRSGWGVMVGVVGVPLVATAIYLAAAILAWLTPGPTFYIPIVALLIGMAAVVGTSALADWCVKHL